MYRFVSLGGLSRVGVVVEVVGGQYNWRIMHACKWMERLKPREKFCAV